MTIVGRDLHQFTELLHLMGDGAQVGSKLKLRHWGGIISGTITDVNDPESKGRIQISPDYTGNKFIAPEWITVVGSHGGRQPSTLIGTKVLIAAIDGSMYEYFIIDTIDGHPGTNMVTSDGEYDANFDLALDKTALKDKLPLTATSGFMKRLPVYSIFVDEGYIPQCSGINIGAQIVYDDGTNTKILTCQRVKGLFSWTFTQQQLFEQ